MGFLSLLFQNPKVFLILFIPLLYSVIIHEIAHGFVAYLFGDNTAKQEGRFSLNPLRHLDPMGTLMLFIAGFGWAKPVPVNYRNLRNVRLGLIFVSLAGCAANIFMAVLAILIMQLPFIAGNQLFVAILAIVIKINIILGSFNLIPIPPLDGSKIVMGFAPARMQYFMARIEPYGFFILIALLFTGLLNPVINFVQTLVVSGISAFLHFLFHIRRT